MRSNFLNTPALDQWQIETIHRAIKEIFEAVITICDKHDIPYYCIDGTLLGAVRHEGFIPWDDDVDIAMDTKQLELFQLYAKEELPNYMYVDPAFAEKRIWSQCPDQTRVYRNDLAIVDLSGMKTHLWIDIMQLVHLPRGKFGQKKYCWTLKYLKLFTRITAPEIIGVNYWKNKTLLRQMVIRLIKKINLGKFISHEKCMKRLKCFLNKYSHLEVGNVMAYPSAYWEKEIVPYEWYGDGLSAFFEGMKVNLPKEYEFILNRLYGKDFMQLPSEEKRKASHIKKIIENDLIKEDKKCHE